MKCPLDQTELLLTERQGVEIDYCPTCRGVWLDRGELDKLIDRADAYDRRDRSRDDDDIRRQNSRDESLPYRPQPARGDSARDPYESSESRSLSSNRSPGADLAGMVGEVLKKKFDDRNRGHYDHDDHRDSRHKKKKGGLFGDLFDF